MAGTCNTLGTHILPVIAACSSLLGKGTVLAQGGVWQVLPSSQVGLNGLLAPREF